MKSIADFGAEILSRFFFFFFCFFNLYLTPFRAQKGRGCGCEGGNGQGRRERGKESRNKQTNKKKGEKKNSKQMGNKIEILTHSVTVSPSSCLE